MGKETRQTCVLSYTELGYLDRRQHYNESSHICQCINRMHQGLSIVASPSRDQLETVILSRSEGSVLNVTADSSLRLRVTKAGVNLSK